jgi:hypothetical protein
MPAPRCWRTATSTSTAPCADARWPAPPRTSEARVFALNFDPELVAIAGFYAVREGFGASIIGRATAVRLDGEQLRFEPLEQRG